MSEYHVPVLLKESIDALVTDPSGFYIDATYGGGGHSAEILSRLSPEGRLMAFDRDSDAIAGRMDDLKKLNGFNITIPYKRDIIPYVDELDASAKRYNSVNCVFNNGGKLIGYNTDCDGFLLSVEAKKLCLSGKVLLAGCGGVGRMMAIEAALHGAELTIGIIPEAAQAAAALTDEIHFLAPDSRIHVKLIDTITGSFDLIVNATPVGMYPNTDACPVAT